MHRKDVDSAVAYRTTDGNRMALRPLAICIAPILYLWPWLLGDAVFAALILSDQGLATSRSFSVGRYSSFLIAAGLALSATLFIVGCLLSLLSAVSTQSLDNTSESRDNAPKREDPRRLSVPALAGGVWVCATSLLPVGLLAVLSGDTTTWRALVAMALIIVVATAWIACSLPESDSYAARLVSHLHRHRLMFAAIAGLLAILPLIMGAYMAMVSPMYLAKVGPLVLSMVGIAANATMFGVVVVTIPTTLQMRWAGLIVFVAMAAWFALEPRRIDRENPLLRDAAQKATRNHKDDLACRYAPTTLSTALGGHGATPKANSSEADPVYLVSAEGGGIRAAYWTAIVLAQLEIQFGDRIVNNIATLSGVSGGSLGIATWLAAKDRTDLSPAQRLDLVDRFLRSDFLSPLLGGLFFLDLPRVLIPIWFPSVTRDQVFEKAVADQWSDVDLGATDFFARRFGDVCLKGFSATAPVIVFNTTDARTGSSVRLTSGLSQSSVVSSVNVFFTSIAEASISQIAHISARFPYLSQPANVGHSPLYIGVQQALNSVPAASGGRRADDPTLKEKLEDLKRNRVHLAPWPREWSLVDGGYLDNTGLSFSEDVLKMFNDPEQAPLWGNSLPKLHLRVIHIANDPSGACVPVDTLDGKWRDNLSLKARRFLQATGQLDSVRCKAAVDTLEQSFRASPFQWAYAPLQTLDSVRGTHSQRLVGQVARETDAFFIFDLALELTNAFDPKAQKEMLQKYMRRRDQLISQRKQRADQLVSEGVLSAQEGLVHRERLEAWRVKSGQEPAKNNNCVAPEMVMPPLGWFLDPASADLMKCLVRQTNRGNVLLLDIPAIQTKPGSN